MQKLERRCIDWVRTGIRLKHLRDHDPDLQRYVCFCLRGESGDCTHRCEECEFDMDKNISRAELARVFHTTESVIANWESGRTSPEIEDILFFAEICHITPEDILVFR